MCMFVSEREKEGEFLLEEELRKYPKILTQVDKCSQTSKPDQVALLT